MKRWLTQPPEKSYNDNYWKEQFNRDVWIHKQLEQL